MPRLRSKTRQTSAAEPATIWSTSEAGPCQLILKRRRVGVGNQDTPPKAWGSIQASRAMIIPAELFLCITSRRYEVLKF